MEKIHIEEFFFHTRDQILRELKRDKIYQNLYEKAEKMGKEFPVIEKLFYDEDVWKIQGVTNEELTAIQEYIDLKRNMEDMVEREHYIRGHRDCLLYLMRCGVLEMKAISGGGG